MTEPAPDGFAVACVVPVRDGAAYLGQALASALAQDSALGEIVVVDDGSTDASAAIARAAGPLVRVVSQAPLGAGTARNRGVAETDAPWIAFLDADDRWLPGKLRLQRDAIRRTPGAVASIGRVRQFFSPDLGRPGAPNPEVLDGTAPTALLVRRETFLATGGFPTDPRSAEAAEWWIRFRELSPVIAFVPEVVAERRLHARNRGVVERDLRRDYLRLAKSMLDRRRNEGPES